MGYSASCERQEALYHIGHERSLSNRLRTWSDPGRKPYIYADSMDERILIVSFTAWESRCYFVLDVAVMLVEFLKKTMLFFLF